MIKYYYDMGDGTVYYSHRDIDFRILSKCKRCLRLQGDTVQILKDSGNEWDSHLVDDKDISWFILKAKKIPRSWD